MKYGIEETARYFGHNVIIKITQELEKQRAEFLSDLKNKDYYWKGYRSTLIEKWEGRR